MLRSYKTEINPTEEQKAKINRTIGVCRYVYNFYLARNKELYQTDQSFLNAGAFSVWLNNDYLPLHPEKHWIKEVSSKAVKQSIEYGYRAFQNFFKGKTKYPRCKKKGRSDVKMYFVKNNPGDCLCERHRIKVPTLGWVRLKEKGYLPVTKSGILIRNGTISIRAGRYYISVLAEVPDPSVVRPDGEGLGIDLGLKTFAACSDGRMYPNISRTDRIRNLEKQLRRAQKCFSRKYENRKKGGATQKNIDRQRLKVQKLYQRITNIRQDYQDKVIAGLVKTKPAYITIEDLNIRGMMKNRYLAKAVASQDFSRFRQRLAWKCRINGIELRITDRWYPSSKTCHACGKRKKDLKLSDRVFTCSCGYREDRDLNAALNLRDALEFVTA